MTNPNDLYITYSGFANNDQIIDSYELIHSLIIEFGGQASFNFLLDPTLPMIKGDPNLIMRVFKDFILKTIVEFKQHLGIVKVVHIKDPKSWIFAFSIDQKSIPNEKQAVSELTDPIMEFNLAISKKVLQNLSEVPSVIAYL